MNIDVEMRFSVGLSKLEVGKMGLTEEIIDSLEYLSTLDDFNADTIDERGYAGVEWLNSRIKGEDAYDWEYVINDFKR